MDSPQKLDHLAKTGAHLKTEGARPLSQEAGDLSRDFAVQSHERDDLALLCDAAILIAAADDLGALLPAIVDRAVALARSERGCLVLVDESGAPHIAAAFPAEQAWPAPDGAFCAALTRQAVAKQQSILVSEARDEAGPESPGGIVPEGIGSALAVPLVAGDELQGALYVDEGPSRPPFGEAERQLLVALSRLAAPSLRAARREEGLRQRHEELQHTVESLRQAQDRLVEVERLAAVGRLAARVAHELRNPLAIMRGILHDLNRLVSMNAADRSPEILRRRLRELDAEIDRQAKIINDLLFFSRNRPRRLAAVDLNAILTETLMRCEMPESVAVVQDLDPTLEPIRADADQIQQVLINVVTNAIQAMPDGGTLSVATRQHDDGVEVTVADTGAGIATEHLAHLFEPFFTTKERGIGLGLPVSRSIVEGHRGSLEVQSQVGVGTICLIRLPKQLIG